MVKFQVNKMLMLMLKVEVVLWLRRCATMKWRMRKWSRLDVLLRVAISMMISMTRRSKRLPPPPPPPMIVVIMLSAMI